jgi:hypothetical protein
MQVQTSIECSVEAMDAGIAKLTKDLGEPTMASQAALAVCMLCESGELPSSAMSLVPPLVSCLSVDDTSVQQNSLSALSGLCAIVPGGREAVVVHGSVPKLVAFLGADTPAAVRLNALEAVGLLSAAAMGLDALLLNDAHLTLLRLLADPSLLAEKEREAAGDVLCSLSSEVAGRSALIDAGAVHTIVALLHHMDGELRVRAMLSLGMLCGDSRAAQQLVSDGGAMRRLRALAGGSMSQTGGNGVGESDEAMIAADVLSTLLRDPVLGQAAASAAGVATAS